MKHRTINVKLFFFLLIMFCTSYFVKAQQFNSDSYISKPLGMATIIVTAGQRYNLLMTTFSLIKNFEFTTAAYIYNDDKDPSTDDSYSTTYYFKWMFFENEKKTGGWAVKFGTGMFPGLLDEEDHVKDAFKTYWMNSPATIPFLNNHISLDLMPGASYKVEYQSTVHPGWAFTYSSRLAVYPFDLKWAVVGEVFGSEGDVVAIPEYKIGLRWEPNANTTFALTYGQEFKGSNGAAFEIGMMLFTPPFLSIGGRHKKKLPE